jgi:hypothetical protein
MNGDMPETPSELRILQREVDAIAQGLDALDAHLAIFLDAFVSLRRYPADQWTGWGWSEQSPGRLHRFGHRMQRSAGKFLAFGNALTRLADARERESASTDAGREK